MTLLDAYAVIGLLPDEPIADDTDRLIRRGGCRPTTLGPAEVVDRMIRLYGAEPDDIAVDTASLGLESTISLDEATGVLAGRLRAALPPHDTRGEHGRPCTRRRSPDHRRTRWRRPISTCSASATTRASPCGAPALGWLGLVTTVSCGNAISAIVASTPSVG